MADCSILDPFKCGTVPLAQWLSDGLRWMVDNYRPFFQAVKTPFDQLLQWFTYVLTSIPPMLVLIFVVLLAWQFGGRRLAAVILGLLVFVGFIGVWNETMVTLAIVLTALVVSVLIGLPLGIWSARNEKVYRFLRPLLDGMQTIPAFVYLVPVVMLFGIGKLSLNIF